MACPERERERETERDENQNSIGILIESSRVESSRVESSFVASERKRFVDFAHAAHRDIHARASNRVYVCTCFGTHGNAGVRSSLLIFTGSPRYFVCARDRNLVYPGTRGKPWRQQRQRLPCRRCRDLLLI